MRFSGFLPISADRGYIDKCTTLSYIPIVIFYDSEIRKNIKKGKIPKEIARLFHHAFQALDSTKDMNLFDIKKLLSNSEQDYFRLRKGKYRAIFTFNKGNYYVLSIAKREEVYKLWP
jgi:mRNA interferase RelE/StbE